MCRLMLPREVFMLLYAECLVKGISLQDAPKFFLEEEGIVVTIQDIKRRRNYLKNQRNIFLPPLKGLKDFNSPTLKMVDQEMTKSSAIGYSIINKNREKFFQKLATWIEHFAKRLRYWGSRNQNSL